MRLVKVLWLLCGFLMLQIGFSQSNPNPEFSALIKTYEENSLLLGSSDPVLSYKSYLRSLGSESILDKQRTFFSQMREEILSIDPVDLSKPEVLEYHILKHEVHINLERIALAIPFVVNKNKVDNKGIWHIENGAEWYRHLVKFWTSSDYTPSEIAQYGKLEIARIKARMKTIESSFNNFQQLRNDPKNFSQSTTEIELAINRVKMDMQDAMEEHFPTFKKLPNLRVARGTNSALKQTPGYYADNTFYYNLFDEPFDLSQIDWMLIHEGNPGHHFQVSYEDAVTVPPHRRSITYSGFREGWAAYVETLGYQMGLYSTAIKEYSWLEWELIRSTRLILDVGINFYGWTDKQALREWKKHIADKDNIGIREIKRMRNWPAQVLTYKVGARAILELQQAEMNRKGDSFSLKDFHTRLLSNRSIPVKLLGLLFDRS